MAKVPALLLLIILLLFCGFAALISAIKGVDHFDWSWSFIIVALALLVACLGKDDWMNCN